ncbi:alpha/beta hydrolase [Variovorax sp. J22R133]|uniref:alpha/beta fold hydrolase n=1 Tax=Variovorax brevis TaxID=3053503 RepID=UPI0025751CEA|nr:alpha/beta hydrolase [Variovorax sp. J22R133]MDM0116813.1 alpha/beta hydrolase [Variovorax sp. J22R133]
MNTATISPPSPFLLLTEGMRAMMDATRLAATWSMRWLHPQGDGHPVLVLPGLGANDLTTKPLRAFLDGLGYQTQGWNQGINCGPQPGVLDKMSAELKAMANGGQKVTVIGWSLGGVYARYLALQHPELVRQIITLGSPFAGDVASATNAGALYKMLSGETVEADDCIIKAIAQTPSVPTTSVFSRTDGVVAWRASLEQEGPLAENIEVRGSHIGLGMNTAVYQVVADRLAQAEGQWQPFARRSLSYPDPARA